MTENTRNELALAINMAVDATPETLENLANLPSSVRNSPEVYDQLGLSTGESVTPVIAYILEQTRREDAAAVIAVLTLSDINTPEAENAILEIAHSVLKNEKHPFRKCIGADAIAALAAMGTDTAADKILSLGRDNDALVYQALTSLGNMYDDDPQTFKSQYRQMLEFVTNPEVMDRTVSIACDTDDEPLLGEAFRRADKRRIFPEVASELRDVPQPDLQGSLPQGYCSAVFRLALAERTLRQDLQRIETVRAELLEVRKLG